MGLHTLSAFMIYALVNAFTPGPGNILALNTMTNIGWRRGKSLFFGIFVGYYFVQVLCAIFVFSLDSLINPVMGSLKYVGSAYIVWLAYRILVSAPGMKTTEKSPHFLIGFMLQVVNVKIYLFGITALTSFVTPYYSTFGAFLFFEMVIATIGTIATLVWILFGKVFHKAYLKYFRIINGVLAILLVLSAIGLFF